MSKPEGALTFHYACDPTERGFVDMTEVLRKSLVEVPETCHYEIRAAPSQRFEVANIRHFACCQLISVVMAFDDTFQGDEWAVTQFALDYEGRWHVDTIWSPGA